MLQKIKVSDDVTIVFSFHDCGYQDVLDTFPEADWIDIVTYHLSTEEERLFECIRNADDAIEIRLITNLPLHWNEYWGNGPKVRLRKQLDIYRSMLAPETIGKEINSFFNVSNHAKIVMTGKLAYIGSMNYSSKSEVNYECGVLFSSTKTIDDIRRDIVDYLVEHSAPHDLSDIGRAKLSIQSLIQRLNALALSLGEGFLQELEGGGETATVIRWSDAEVSEEELERFASLINEWESLLDGFEEHAQLHVIAEFVDYKLLEDLRFLVEDSDSALRQLAEFNYTDAVDGHMQKYLGRADSGSADILSEVANEDAEQERKGIVENAVKNMRLLRDLVIKACNQNRAVLSKLQELERTKWGVDNT